MNYFNKDSSQNIFIKVCVRIFQQTLGTINCCTIVRQIVSTNNQREKNVANYHSVGLLHDMTK